MIFSVILLITGLTLSAVAIYYSVIGLTAIFAASFWPIVVMGTTLEVSKLVAATWLKAYWNVIPTMMKWYMTTAVIVLMIITSMGIFGFLSKAHTEQAVPLGDNQAQVQIIDERIAIEQEIIEQARRELTILNQQIERFSELGAVTRGVNARNQQREEREALTAQITEAQNNISQLRQERAPFASTLRAIEAEVGPIKYIAKLIYGDSPDQNLLERAVVWVIIIIVLVFDPMAVLLLLGALMTWQWSQHQQPQQDVITAENSVDIEETAKQPEPSLPWPFTVQAQNTTVQKTNMVEQSEPVVQEVETEPAAAPHEIQTFDNAAHAKTYVEDKDIVDDVGVEAWNKLLETAEQEVQREREQQRIRPDFTEVVESEESKKKTTYMIKEQNQQVKKTREE